MAEINLNNLYFKWICSMVFPDEEIRNRYSNVLIALHNTDFHSSFRLDENRLKDGIDLRYHFCCDCKIPYDAIRDCFRNDSCSMLEMMASLAKRCEETLMANIEYGDRTHIWFQLMFNNLGLDNFPNETWNVTSYYSVKNIIDRCLYREYNADGSNGGLFICHSHYYDLRNIQIWDQMCIAMNEILGY